jgi:5-methylthioadenosine/S-adenosylhomocysteine deaminase
MLADIIIIDLKRPHLLPVNNIISTIVYSATGNDVDSVIINGKFVMKERSWATFNRFPLDIYVGDSFKFLEKMNDDEIPTVIKGENYACLYDLQL